MAVSVVIVNYRTPELTMAAVESALAQSEAVEVIVVDNASGDDSVSRLKALGGRVILIESSENIGFGRANNLGVERACQEFVFLLNSDALLHAGCLGKLLAYWTTLDRPGILAPAVYLADGKTLQPDAQGPFPTVWGLITRKSAAHDTSLTPDWVSGCAMLMRREDFLAVGGFDSEIFMYYEDVVLCHAIRGRGLGVQRCLDAAVTHLGGKSIARSSDRKKVYYQAQDIMLRRLGEPSWAIALVRLLRIPYQLLQRLRSF
ncbi:MAG: glycosyltransferase family 2 protein [Methanoregulaceae archaeon]|nr:glycosyltransferase family 2 protein [Methanoregulaceae archaeon]